MAYVTPTSKTTGDLIDASEWNQNTVDNPIALRTGGIAIASQAANDILYASSSTQLARLAAGTAGQVLSTQGAGSAPSWIDQSQGLRQTFRGLSLRTHPDSDVAAYKVFLNHADEIVMHDGTRVADWDDLTADITASGAGGLDTGSEGASRWYEIHAIRKSSDGTKNLLLHRAKNRTVDQSMTSDPASIGLLASSNRQRLGQTFTPAVTGLRERFDVRLFKNASAAGTLYLELYATSSSLPTGAALATSDKIDQSLISTSSQTIAFIFRSPVSLTAGTEYALVLRSTQSIDATNYISWRLSTAGVYSGGQAVQYDGTTWSAVSSGYDFVFYDYVTQNDTAVTMPTGYDQRALIGYVYNNSSSNFRPLRQVDKRVIHEQVVSSNGGTNSFMTLLDLSAIVPPVPVVMTNFQLQISGAAGGTTNFNGEINANGAGVFAYQNDGASSNVQPLGANVFIDYQVGYYSTNRTLYVYHDGFNLGI
jgi:hypothetical protein